MIYSFIFLFFSFYLILAWRRIDLAVLFLLVALPSYLIRFLVFGVPFTLLEGMILISFGVWFLKNYKKIASNIKIKLKNPKSEIRNLKSERYPFDIEIVLVLIVSFIAVGVAGFSDSALGAWKAYFFEPLLVYILIINVFGRKGFSRERLERKEGRETHGDASVRGVFWALAISAFVVSLFAIYQKITGQFIFNEFWANSESRRVVSFFGYPNAVGLFLGPLVLLLTGWVVSRINFVKKRVMGYQLWVISYGLVTIFLSILAIYFAQSKGALLGVGVGFIVFGLFYNKYIRRVIIGVGCIIGIGLLFFNPGIKSTYTGAGSAYVSIYEKVIYSKSFQIRKQGWIESWGMLKDGRLIFGAGLSKFQTEVKPYHKDGFFYNDGTDPDFHRHTVFNDEYRARAWQPLEVYIYPHNIFLNFWSEIGFLGMILFLWIIGRFFYVGILLHSNLRMNYKSTNKEAGKLEIRNLVIGLICAMVVVVVHGLVDVPYFKNDLAVLFWVMMAILGLVRIANTQVHE